MSGIKSLRLPGVFSACSERGVVNSVSVWDSRADVAN